MAADDQFMVSRAGKRMGPYSGEQIRLRLLEGTISPDDLAQKVGLQVWVPLRDLMDIPRETHLPSAARGEAALGYVNIIIKKTFGRTGQIKIPIPPQGVHEPKATSKQKEQLIELGIVTPEVVQNLGSGQAGYMIDQILIARKENGSRRMGVSSSTLIAGVGVVAMVVGAVLIFRRAGDYSAPAGSPGQQNPRATNKSTDPRFTLAAREPSERRVIPGLSPQKLYDMLGLQERGFDFEPPEPSNPGNWLFKLAIDGKTYEITVHGSNSHSIEWVEVKIDVMQGYDINELAQSFFGSIAGMGSTSESALAAQKWVKEHVNTSDAATFGALDFQFVSEGSRRRKLIISPSKTEPLGGAAPSSER